MKTILITLSFFVNFNIYSQDTIQLHIDNPKPRVGEEIELSFKFNFFTDEVQKQLNPGIEMSDRHSVFGGQSNEFTSNISFTEAGPHTIGPFKFNFNGKEIITNSILVQVDEKLPIKEGIWVRYAEVNNKKYIVIEQMIRNKPNENKKENITSTITYGGSGGLLEEDEFAELNSNLDIGISATFKKSLRNTVNGTGLGFQKSGLTYSLRIYELKTEADFSGNFTLTKRHFTNLPKGHKIKKIRITD